MDERFVVKMPVFSEPFVVRRVLVRIGDVIAKGDPLVELETDMAIFEMPSPAAGVVGVIHVSPGTRLDGDDLVVELECQKGLDRA